MVIVVEWLIYGALVGVRAGRFYRGVVEEVLAGL